ncbi:threonine/serine dehydratase [Rhodobacteraceae bacterium NNCM2]|nr:threonine/serine dehydratase [Coraliihabitans acroporae]
MTDKLAEAVSIDDIRAARERLAPVVRTTPLLESALLNEVAGRRLLIKPECLQLTGSFKFRGAWSALSSLDEATRSRGVLAFSSGNHAQGVARAAQLFGVPAVIIMPNDAPALKIANTKAYGAEVVLYDRPGGESREEIGSQLAAERGLTLVRPYDEPMVMAGQGTTGLEIAEQARAAGVEGAADVIVCCGGGGLAAGIALALEAEAPDFTLRTAEPATSDDYARSLVAGERRSNQGPITSICDAIVTPMPGELTFPILSRLAGPGLSVTDDEALRAMAQAFLHLKVVAEPGGAVALAAGLYRGEALGDTAICVISGGNVDPGIFARALATLD